ncbi:MAG TPA: TetR/AcrR family transcriptional regulator [Acidobacteriota bacterium]|nr:TetR/AcrR family transcriptional regulator [Acidobacteriota bacterium]
MQDTKDRILDTAERLFAERGYDATSLRAITREAGVNLAAVNYHFNSKESLLRALFGRKLGKLNERRIALLDSYEAEAGVKPVALEKIVRAFVEPVLRLGGDPASGGTGFAMLMGRMYSWPSVQLQRVFVSELREQIGRFRAAFRRALPHLPPRELYWRVFFSIGAMAHALAGSGLLAIISDGVCDPADTDGLVERLIGFMVAGLKAPLSARINGRHGKRAVPAIAHPVHPSASRAGNSTAASRR